MFHSGSGSNGLAILVDSRTKSCKEVHGCLDLFGPGNRFLGKTEWKNTLRIALRDYDDEPHKPKELEHEKAQVRTLLRARGIRAVIVLQSPSHLSVRKCDHSFSVVGPGGSPYKWAGTVWPIDIGDYQVFCCPILNPGNYEHVYEYLIRRWFQQAIAVAQGQIQPFPWPHLETDISGHTAELLETIANDTRTPIACDIETNLGGGIITAIGFSNGAHSVSIPWDGFTISGTTETEPDLKSRPFGHTIEVLARKLLASSTPKIFHNGAFDVYELGKRDISVNNFSFDTLLMHRVVYPQFRHGLQQAAATEFAVEPWKCLWKPPNRMRGSDQDVWLSDPSAMHIYNAKDALITWQLWKHLSWKCGLRTD